MPYLHITRDSVAAGDDVDAPHRKRITVAASTSLSEVLAEVRYLEQEDPIKVVLRFLVQGEHNNSLQTRRP